MTSVRTAISISLGSTTRDKRIEIELLDTPVILERKGTDGDTARATALFTALDGRVDAFGVGGIDLWLEVDGRKYALHAAHKLIANVTETPIVDGGGLKNTLERLVADTLREELGPRFASGRVLCTAAVDRYGMARSFFDRGYDVVCADLMFALGIPIPIRTLRGLHRLARSLLPILGHLPISFLYPTGDMQHEIVPRFQQWYAWADIIAGDCHYIRRHMPDSLAGKVIVTNTTTPADLLAFRQRGVRYVMTTTPRLDGRSFGTNMMEAALTALVNKGRPLAQPELDQLMKRLELKPALADLADLEDSGQGVPTSISQG
jgi:hypothetical protein